MREGFDGEGTGGGGGDWDWVGVGRQQPITQTHSTFAMKIVMQTI